MKRMLEDIADYNAQAMEAMLAVLDRAPASLLSRDVGVYYKSVDGIVEHMAWAAALWLKRFAGFGSYPCLESSPLVARPMDELRAEAKGDRARAAALLRESAALLLRFASELPEAEFERRVRYRATDGQELERLMGHALFQVLNHGTHHRGEVSAILDMNGVPNDFNSFVTYMP